jgi:hypothetical protein
MTDPTTTSASLDVVNRGRLSAYLELRSRALLQLKGDEIHSVYGQITAMIDGDRAWRALNEMRRMAAERRATDGTWASAIQNGMLADFVDTGYVATQALAIRRLIEQKASNPKGQIISIRRVLAAVKGGRGSITRECFVCHDGLPYDTKPGAAQALAAAASDPEDIHWIETEGPGGWAAAELLHEEFDGLSGVPVNKRSRDDLIRMEVFDELEALLADPAFGILETYANKFVAHSADERSRAEAGSDVILTMDRISTCHEAIIRVFHRLVGDVFQVGTHSPVAVRSEPFKHLDRPLIATDQMSALRQWWIEYGNALEEHVGVLSRRPLKVD